MLSPNDIYLVTKIIYLCHMVAFLLIPPTERHFFSYGEWR
jgi:hypothetical protein